MKKLLIPIILVAITTQLYAKQGESLEQREAEREIAAGEPGVSLEQAHAERVVEEERSGRLRRVYKRRGCCKRVKPCCLCKPCCK